VAADVYRPAAVLQLQQLGERIEVAVHTGAEGAKPADICAAAAERARAEGFDAIIYDTAGRLAIDEALMEELREIVAVTSPANTLLVCDSLMGRDAVNVAKAFSEKLDLDGLVLTKLDGDARGGAALSIRHVTGRPVVMVGVGEKLDALELFHPERMAGRILGMGDVVSLVEDVQEKIDQNEAQRVAERMFTKSFNLDDLLAQLEQVQRMGNLKDLMKKLPGQLTEQFGEADLDDGALARQKAIIQSMTSGERYSPDEIHGQRRQRIARGSGTSLKEVNELLKSFKMMRKQMKGLKDSFMGRMSMKQMEKRKSKLLKQMKRGNIPGIPG